MEENSKKRSRKSKLVPRECLDSDDENIAVMQEEIEATLMNLKSNAILKKNNNAPSSAPLQFSIKVEVEEFDEDQRDNLNIRIDSVKSLCKTIVPSAPVSRKEPKIVSFRFTEQTVKNEFEKLSYETTDAADKLIEIHMKNYFGKVREHLQLCRVDQILQHIFRKKWKNWRNTFPKIRDIPLMYKCYGCNRAWWYLYDFREHILHHDTSYAIGLETNFHECNVIAYQAATPQRKDMWIDGDCWRCGKNLDAHSLEHNKHIGYKCKGCMEKFYTCSLLKNHENTCLVYISLQQDAGEEINFDYPCTQCCERRASEDELLKHMVLRHSVRSDVPLDWTLRNCGRCDYPFHLQALHDCPYKAPSTSCEFCLQKFKSHLFVLIHLNATQHFFSCRICGKNLRKQCMELEHLTEHSENYTLLYKCIYCTDLVLFPSVVAVNRHKCISHAKLIENRNIGSCYEIVVIPTRLIVNHRSYKYFESEKTPALSTEPEKSFDTACQELMGFLDEKQKIEVAIKDTIKNDVEIISDHEEVIIIDSSQEDNLPQIVSEKDNHPEPQITIEEDNPQEPQITKEEEPQKNQPSEEIRKIGEDKSGYISQIKSESKKIHIKIEYNQSFQPINKRPHKVYKRKIHPQKDTCVDTQTPDTSQDNELSKELPTSNETVKEIPEIPQTVKTEINTLDPYLMIKQEILEDDEMTGYSNLQPEEACEIEIGKVVNIKQEIMDIQHHDLPESINEENCNNLSENLNAAETKLENVEGYNLVIKEEVVDEGISNNHEESKEEIHFQIKEEALDELCEDDMIILDPNNTDLPMPSFKLELLDTTNETSVTSDDIEMQNLQPEVIAYQPYGKKKYKCRKCSFEGFHQAYKIHLQEEGHHRTKTKCLRKVGSVKGPVKGVRYTCTKCKVTYPTFYKYIMHFNKVHDYKMLTCPKCFRPLLNVQTLHSHVLTHVKDSFVSIYLIKTKDNGNDNTHQCKTCSEKLTTSQFFTHWESHLEIRKDPEEWKGFLPEMEHKHDLKMMLLLLQGLESPSTEFGPQEKLRQCLKCKRRFERKNECKRHFIEHLLVDAYQDRHKNGFLKCQICAQDFYTSERYKRHMRDHASLPLYKCELCDKAFSDSSNFTKHKKVHNLSVLICDICNKKFTGKPFLEKHMQMHQQIKPLVCNECNKVFYTESSYKKHLSRGLIRFRCPSCNVFFNCLRDKWDHMWEVHKERKFLADCPLCKKSFRKHQDVRLHIRMEHQEVKYKYVPNKMEITDHCRQRKRKVNAADELVVVYSNNE